ncbi:hypothetical protein RN001_011321 [Aquatica leii]|uniref:CRAL-TRIO domain-containing protein n=1 Tax=Aquatica leii TaxID=1421715 RepID=A0AAN7P252_9COLE|nr:hypothetical protein RN001_011321 [Aquatica leii]
MHLLKLGFVVPEVVKKGLTTEEDIEAIKEWRKDKWPQLTEEQIAIFLIACNNCQELTKYTIESNIRIKNSGPNLFTDRNFNNENLRKISQVMTFSVMPDRYQDTLILVISMNDFNYKNYCQEAHFKLYFMVIDSIAYDNPPREAIIIVDAKGVSLMHITTIRMNLLKLHSEYFDRGLPLACREVHFINCSYALTCCFNVTKPFIRSDKLQKIHFHHGTRNDTIPETLSIPKKYLPKEYGGELKSVRYYHNRTMDKLVQMQQYFDLEEQQRS